jgi:hypothetical protein
MNKPLPREFRLVPSGSAHGVSCDENGVFVDSIPLLKRVRANDIEWWEPRDAGEVSAELGELYGLPVDVASKSAGLAAIARALNGGAIARAQVLALHLEFPSAPALMKSGASREEIVRFIRELYWSGLIKADWDPDEHPRWPKGTPESQGGRFAPKGEGGESGSAAIDDGVYRSPDGGATLDDGVYRPDEDSAELDRIADREPHADRSPRDRQIEPVAVTPSAPPIAEPDTLSTLVPPPLRATQPGDDIPAVPSTNTHIDPDDEMSLMPFGRGTAVGNHGYVPAPGDETLLARAIMAEGSDTPEDMAALGWAMVNRVGVREFGQTLNAVIYQVRNGVAAFSFTTDGSPIWPKTVTPEEFTGDDAGSWQKAVATAHGIFDGTIPDPTEGATLYFASRSFDGTTKTAPKSFKDMLSYNHIVASQYESPYPELPYPAPRTNFFFIENPRSEWRDPD